VIVQAPVPAYDPGEREILLGDDQADMVPGQWQRHLATVHVDERELLDQGIPV